MKTDMEKKPFGYWTYKRCKKEASKYKTRNEFRKGNPSAEVISRRNNWLDDFFPKPFRWTYDLCKAEALKYDTLADFCNNSNSALVIARKRGWLKDFYWLKKRFVWTYDLCKEEASKYKTRKEFFIGNRGAHSKAVLEGWIDDWFDKVDRITWDIDLCKEAAKECSSRGDLALHNNKAYNAARKHGWLDELESYYKPREKKIDNALRAIYAYIDKENNWVYVGLTKMSRIKERDREHRNGKLKKGVRVYDTVWKHFNEVGKPIPEPIILMVDLTKQESRYHEDWYKKAYQRAGWTTGNKGKTGEFSSSIGDNNLYWDYDRCKAEAAKYETRKKFQKGCPAAYRNSTHFKWINDFFGDKYKWTSYDNCKAEAAKYSSREELRKGCSGAYNSCYRNKWLDDFYGKLSVKPFGYWNYDNCKAEAAKYSSKKWFEKGNTSAYQASVRKGWINDFYPAAA